MPLRARCGCGRTSTPPSSATSTVCVVRLVGVSAPWSSLKLRIACVPGERSRGPERAAPGPDHVRRAAPRRSREAPPVRRREFARALKDGNGAQCGDEAAHDRYFPWNCGRRPARSAVRPSYASAVAKDLPEVRELHGGARPRCPGRPFADHPVGEPARDRSLVPHPSAGLASAGSVVFRPCPRGALRHRPSRRNPRALVDARRGWALPAAVALPLRWISRMRSPMRSCAHDLVHEPHALRGPPHRPTRL